MAEVQTVAGELIRGDIVRWNVAPNPAAVPDYRQIELTWIDVIDHDICDHIGLPIGMRRLYGRDDATAIRYEALVTPDCPVVRIT